ncbi:hypothetical protein CRG98_032166 [Punica granatum]|uniref:Uncharacterized protein n=1 Tax=Punica granatum TaxID=22663 RepID=A0A2I0ITX6_PUNGR|nr:hypothetical protein CRG98_032166 [Punica granatum]
MRGQGRQSATLTPPLRPLAPTEDTGDLDGGVKVADWRLRPLINRGPPTWSPQSIRGRGHQSVTPTPPRGRRYPPWVPGTSVEGLRSGLPIGDPKTFDSESPIDSVSRLPIGDPDPLHRGRQYPRKTPRRRTPATPNRPGTPSRRSPIDSGGPRSIRGRRLAAPTPPSLSIFFIRLK